MRKLLTIILTFFFGISSGQNFTYPLIKAKGRIVADFVPAGWTILDSTYGELNSDYTKDAAIIIQHKDSVLLVNSLEDTVLTQPYLQSADFYPILQ